MFLPSPSKIFSYGWSEGYSDIIVLNIVPSRPPVNKRSLSKFICMAVMDALWNDEVYL